MKVLNVNKFHHLRGGADRYYFDLLEHRYEQDEKATMKFILSGKEDFIDEDKILIV